MSAAAKARVLHVEDDKSQQNLVRIVLAQAGKYEVDSAGDGISAVEIACRRRPDLVLLDLNLPGFSGVHTLAALREIAGMQAVHVVFLTASADLITHVELIQKGAAAVLLKPIRPLALARRIEALIDEQRGARP